MRLVATLALASSILVSRPALAEDRALARRLFISGDRAFAQGDFAAALEAYSAAYEAAPLPGFLFNMGQCHRKLEHWELARDFFTRYLEAVPDAFNRADVERLLEEAAGHLPPEQSGPVEAALPPSESRLEPPSTAQAPRASPERVDRGSSVGLPAWISLGAGLALAGGAVYFALVLENAQADFDDPALDCSSELERCRELRDRGDSAALFRTILAGASAATLVLAAVLVTLDLTASPGSSDEAPRMAVSLGPAALEVRGTF
ncbi:MAG: tetratricopeptide repeat protein [Deltaproteobacteria bacterium]|nr:tetratricopeptide repeat protein [Deltaproteobacteria bacterium]